MQGQVVLIHLEAPAGGGLRRSDGSTGPPERLSILIIAVQKRERGIYRRIRGSEMQLAPTCFHSGAVKWPENDLQSSQYSRVKN